MKRRSNNVFNRLVGGGLLLFLSSFSALGVGFSSWASGSTIVPDDANISASIGEIKNNNYFLGCNVDMFYLGPDGLVEDYTIVDNSKITVTIYIDNAIAYPSSNAGTLTFNAILSCTNNSFLGSFVENPTITNITEVSTSLSESGSDLTSSITCSVPNNTNISEFIATYKVKGTDTSSNKIGDFYSNKPTFSYVLRSN